MKRFIYLILIFFFNFKIYALDNQGLIYNRYAKDQHVIHVLTIDPKYFYLKLIKAHNQVIGRETVEAIAKRTNAVAAINAGFFEIAGSDDGRPSLTLMIDGMLFGLKKQTQSLLIIDQNNIQITKASAKISVKIGDSLITPSQLNYFSNTKDITLYNNVWAPTTLTPYTNKEILINYNSVVAEISEHGDNKILQNGFVLSFGADRMLPTVKVGEAVKLNIEFIDQNNNPLSLSSAASIVTGVPMLIQNSKVVTDKSDDKEGVHARTALGIRKDGNIVILVVEHIYKQNIKNLKLEQVRSILKKEKGVNLAKLTLPEALKILQNHLCDDSVIGLTQTELAEYMLNLGCDSAINLDGGGSSTLFMNGKIVNNITGDKDEALGEYVMRPVSDAIIIMPNK